MSSVKKLLDKRNSNVKYFLDTEFMEYPCTIHLLSIGIVCEDAREYYAINRDANHNIANIWVQQNVLPQLEYGGLSHKVSLSQMKQEILEFIGSDIPEFWGYFADYDWVVFCWIFGRMIDLPQGWPMYCNDLKQLSKNLDNPKFPPPPPVEHNALYDARWNKLVWESLHGLREVSAGQSAATPL